MDKNIILMSPEELNSLLIKKYNLGLNIFAFFIKSTLFLNPSGSVSISEFNSTKKKLQSLKRKIKSTIVECESLWTYLYSWDKYQSIPTDISNAISKDIGAERFIDYINDQILIIDEHLESGQRKLGAHIKCRNIIVTLWALLINHAKKKIEWENLADLLDWFWERLKSYNTYKILTPKDEITDSEYLRNQFYRNKRALTKNFYAIINCYFAGRIPYKKAELTVIFGEKFHTEIYHSELRKRGLSLFAKPNEIPIYEAIIEKISGRSTKRISKLESLKEEINLASVPLSEIRSVHYYYAFKLYRKNPDSPPLIIFPDLSYLK